MENEDENAVANYAVEAQHRAAGCFHALLSVLQKPVAAFVATARAFGPELTPEDESKYGVLPTMGLQMHLWFVSDHWATHFQTATSKLAEDLRRDVDKVLQVQAQAIYAAVVDVKSYESGIAAVLRLLVAVDADEDVQCQAQVLKMMMLNSQPIRIAMPGSELSDQQTSTTMEVDADVEAEENAIASATAAAAVDSSMEPPHDEEPSACSESSEGESNLSAILEEARSESAAQIDQMSSEMDEEKGPRTTEGEPLALEKKINQEMVVIIAEDHASRPNEGCTEVQVTTPAENGGDELRKAKSCIDEQDFDTAVLWINKEIARSTENTLSYAKLLVMRAQCHFELKQYVSVCNDCQNALAINKTLVEAYELVTRALIELNRLSEAHSTCHAGLKVHASDFKLKTLERQLGRLTLAASKSKKAASLSSSGSDACSTSTGPIITQQNSKNASKELRTAQSCIDKRDFSNAVFWINKEIARSKANTLAHAKLLVMRARCRFKLTQYLQVYNDCQDALAINKMLVDAYQWAALALIELNRLSEAHSMCHAGLKLDDSDTKLKALEREICRMGTAASKAKNGTSESSNDTGSMSASTKAMVAKGSAQAPGTSNTANQLKVAIANGINLIEKNDIIAAEASFTKALKLMGSGPAKRVSVLGHRARCLLELKQYEAAMADAREALKLKVDWLEGHRLVCKAMMGLGRWQEAHIECEAVLRGAPQDVIFLGLKQTIAAKIATVSEPLKSTTEAPAPPTVAQWPAQVKALVQAGFACVEEKKYVEADTSFTKALAALAALNGASTDATIINARVKALGHRGRCRFTMGSYLIAASDARVGIKLQPNWIDGYRLLCHALMGTRQWSEALVACRYVLKHDPQDTEFPKFLELLQEKCRASSSATLSGDLSQFQTLSRRAVDHLKVKEYEQAASCCTQSIALLEKPTVSTQTTSFQKAGGFINRARCWVALNKFEAALQDARTGLAHSPDWAEAHRVVSVSLMGLGRWREALPSCEHVLERVPTDTTFQVHKVSITVKLKQLSAPHPPAPSSVASDEAKKNSLAQLKAEGLKLFTSGDLQAAESIVSTAITLLGTTRSKKSASFFGDRARCRVVMKKFHEALDDAREGLVCNPTWTEGYRLQCHAFMGLGQWHQASQMCERVLELVPHDVAFQTVKLQIDSMLQLEQRAATEEKTQEETIAQVYEVEEPREEEVVSVSKAPTSQSAVSTARMRELDAFAAHGSIVARRFLFAQSCLQNAESCLKEGDVPSAFYECRRALKRWPELEIPRDIADDLRTVGSHDAIAWGGAMLYFHLQAVTMQFASYSAERVFWKQRVERYPHDSQLHAKFAFVLYRGGETNAALQHAEEALQIDRSAGGGTLNFGTATTSQYVGAMSTPIEAASSPLSWLSSVFSSQSEPRTRAEELLKYIQQATVDDEWMPHTCYSLGVLHLDKRAYIEATQFFFLASEAEIHRSKLQLYPEIDENEFNDKAVLRAVVGWPSKKLSSREEYETVSRPIVCAWCSKAVSVNAYFEHKQEQCVNRPEWKADTT